MSNTTNVTATVYDPIAQTLLGSLATYQPPQNLISFPPIPTINTGSKLDDDQEYARQNLIDVVQKSSNAIGELMEISRASQHPRSYEVLEKLLMRQQDAATKLLELHRARTEINREAAKAPIVPAGGTYIANAVFTGTMAELLDGIRGKNRDIIEHEDLLDLEDPIANT
jgi:hypothetical protein